MPDRRRAADSLRTRLQRLPDRLLFGAEAEEPGAGGLLRRFARYPYAMLRDLAGGKLNLHAMGLVYASLLAVIPLIAFSFGILRGFHAQGILQPLVHDFFAPMGSAADELTARVMEFANKVRGGLVGSVGLALLIWTLIGTMKKIEDGFNFVWHVDVPRNFARRMAEYVALLITGPVLLAAVVGLSRLAAESEPVRALSELPLMVRVVALALSLAPYVIASGLLTIIYMVVPNTHVRFGPALAGGIAAGILWAAIGRFFTLFVLYSSRLTIVYAGFAIIIATLVWTYFNWIILLLGAQVSFYAQNPSYLRIGLHEPRLSSADTERLALGVMYLVAERYRAGGEAPHDPGAGGQTGLSRHCRRAHVRHARNRGLSRRGGGRITTAGARHHADCRGRDHHGGAGAQQRPYPHRHRDATSGAAFLRRTRERLRSSDAQP